MSMEKLIAVALAAGCVLMVRSRADDPDEPETTAVSARPDTSIDVMKANGWQVAEGQGLDEDGNPVATDAAAASEGLTKAQIKARLTELGVDLTGVADTRTALAELLDAQA